MKNKVRHVLGISGGKDSAALAIYLKDKYPELDIEYYFCDTGKELDETYKLVQNLEVYLGKRIIRLEAAEKSHEAPFDHFLKLYGGFLPSSNARWCTKKLKLEPFENFVGDNPVVSYVGIRGDEDRDGYISRKPNIQSIFPFRKNIWSQDVINKALKNDAIPLLKKIYEKQFRNNINKRFALILLEQINTNLTIRQKFELLLEIGTREFNRIVFEYLKGTDYPLSKFEIFPLIENEDVLVRDDIFRILKESGVGVPKYYNKKEFKVDGEKGEYARSRSGCYFCFFQQKIEWVWLFEQHPDKFKKAMEYEKDGYTWMQDERLEDIIQPERIQQIKEDHLKRTSRDTDKKSPYLLDILEDSEEEGCAACFI